MMLMHGLVPKDVMSEPWAASPWLVNFRNDEFLPRRRENPKGGELTEACRLRRAGLLHGGKKFGLFGFGDTARLERQQSVGKKWRAAPLEPTGDYVHVPIEE